MGDIRGLTGGWLGLRQLGIVSLVREVIGLFSGITRLVAIESHLTRNVLLNSFVCIGMLGFDSALSTGIECSSRIVVGIRGRSRLI